jgi:hypothetical protein
LESQANIQEAHMSRFTIQQRLETLESEVAQLRDELHAARDQPAKDWRRAVEKYAGDPDLQIVFAEAMKLREADRKRARKRTTGRGSR